LMAVALPIPDAAPVMRHTLPWNLWEDIVVGDARRMACLVWSSGVYECILHVLFHTHWWSM
jgi:hypothetical protein